MRGGTAAQDSWEPPAGVVRLAQKLARVKIKDEFFDGDPVIAGLQCRTHRTRNDSTDDVIPYPGHGEPLNT